MKHRNIRFTLLLAAVLILPLAHTEGQQIQQPQEVDIQTLQLSSNTITNYTESTPDFLWLDARTKGEPLNVNGDDVFGTLQLPFVFNFYNGSFTNVNISSNGWLSFNSTNPTSTDSISFPISSEYYVIAPFWKDLISSNNIFYMQTNDYVWIEYSNIIDYDTDLTLGSFAVLLMEDGGIAFFYHETAFVSSFPAVGLNFGMNTSYFNSYEELNGTSESGFALGYNFNGFEGITTSIALHSVPVVNNTETFTTEVMSFGDVSSIMVDVYINDQIVNQAVVDIAAGTSAKIETSWVPTSLDVEYNITATATILEGETLVNDNTRTILVSAVAEPNYTMQETDYTWFDAQQFGVQIGLSGDDSYQNVTLPFDFQFYDRTFSNVSISTNGYLSFNDTQPDIYNNPGFPILGEYDDDGTLEDTSYTIAPLWDDLETFNKTYVLSTADYVVFEYINPTSHSTDRIIGNFSVVLYAYGAIEFHYQNISVFESPTIGLNLGDGVYSNSYHENLANITEFALSFSIFPTLIKQQDLTLNYGLPNLVEFVVRSAIPQSYTVEVDGQTIVSSSWSSGTIIFDMGEYGVGVYDVVFTLVDQMGNTVTNAFTVTIVDVKVPTITTSGDLSYDEGSTGNVVTVTVNDDTNGTYVIQLDGSDIGSGNYIANEEISVNVDGLEAGVHTFSALVEDASGNSATATLVITVNADTTDTSSSSSTTGTTATLVITVNADTTDTSSSSSTTGTKSSETTTETTTSSSSSTTGTTASGDTDFPLFAFALLGIPIAMGRRYAISRS
ncbi:MAG: hypothetical protein ACXAE3_15760 [Candidatus Kariarchaeaceae archaeon]|jgi:hypothetical protein